jgi:hypothetical protein
MKLRKRAFSKKTTFTFISIIVACLVWVGLRLIFASLDENHVWKIYFENNLITEIGATIFLGILTGAFSLRKGISLSIPVWGDDRIVFTKEELQQKFSCDAGFYSTLESGWKVTGEGSRSLSIWNI